MMNVIMICLGDSDTKECRGIIRMLHSLLAPGIPAQEKKRIAQEEYGIPMNKELDREVDDMCNISELYINHGRAEGRVEGRAEGRVEGRAEGALEKTIKMILKLAKNGMSIEDIADTAELTVEETEKIIKENS